MRRYVVVALMSGVMSTPICGMNAVYKLIRSYTQKTPSNVPTLITAQAGKCGSHCCLNNPDIRKIALQFPDLIRSCPKYKLMPHWQLTSELLNAKTDICTSERSGMNIAQAKSAVGYVAAGSCTALGIVLLPTLIAYLSGGDFAAVCLAAIAEVGGIGGFKWYQNEQAQTKKELQEKIDALYRELDQRKMCEMHVHDLHHEKK